MPELAAADLARFSHGLGIRAAMRSGKRSLAALARGRCGRLVPTSQWAGTALNGPARGTTNPKEVVMHPERNAQEQDSPVAPTTKLREKVERGIYRRKTRGGETRYEVAYLDSDGKQRWRTVASLREARLLRADLVTKVGRGERVAPTNVTVAAFADAWLERQESRLRPTTHSL